MPVGNAGVEQPAGSLNTVKPGKIGAAPRTIPSYILPGGLYAPLLAIP